MNYLSDAYTIYSASAQSISSTTRSVLRAAPPLPAPAMYRNLGFAWACSLLGFLSCIIILIPFGFIYWGDDLRRRSRFCQRMEMLREEGREMSATRLGDKDESLNNNVVVHGVLERGERGSIPSMSLRPELIDVVIGSDGGVMGSDGEYCGKKERTSWTSLI